MSLLEFVSYIVGHLRGDPYFSSENYPNRGYCGFYRRTRIRTRTLSGMNACYRLHLNIDVVDRQAFRRAKMLDDSAQSAFVEAFNEEVILPLLENCFFAFCWAGDISIQYPRPYLALFELVHRDGKATIERARESLISKAAEQTNWIKNGCRAQNVFLFSNNPALGLIDSKTIEENYAMLTSADLAQAEVDVTVKMAIEKAVIDAMKRIKTVEEAREDEIRHLASRLETATPPPPDSRYEKWRADSAYQGAKYQMIEELKKRKVSQLDALKQSSVYKALSTYEQEEWVQRLEDDFAGMESAIWGNEARRRPGQFVRDAEATMRAIQSLAESEQKMHEEVDKSNLSADGKQSRHREIKAYYGQVVTLLRQTE